MQDKVNKKILWLTNIPSPYRVDFFNELGKYCSLTVLFEKSHANYRNEAWKKYNFDSFNGILLKSISVNGNTALSFQFIKYIKEYKNEIIVINNPLTPTGISAIFYMQAHHIKYYIESDGAIPNYAYSLKDVLKRRLFSRAEACFTTSELGIDYFLQYSVSRKKIYKYPFSSISDTYVLDHVPSGQEKQSLRKELKLQGEKIIVSVGRFIEIKGFDVLLESLRCVNQNVHTYIIGNKPTENYLNYCETHNLTNVHFVDFMAPKELKKWYLAADLFVLPTRSDVWGLVINEAMACALPVVTTNRCGAGVEMIHEGKNGRLVDINDSIRLAEAINDIINMGDLKSICDYSLSVAGNYTIEKMAKKHVELFYKLNK